MSDVPLVWNEFWILSDVVVTPLSFMFILNIFLDILLDRIVQKVSLFRQPVIKKIFFNVFLLMRYPNVS